jgi:hypothetical protein
MVPVCCVNAIIFFSVSNIIEVSNTIHFLRFHPLDFIQFFGAFFCAVYFDVDTGLVFCILYSLFSIIKHSSFPSVSFPQFGNSASDMKPTDEKRTKAFNIEHFMEELKEMNREEMSSKRKKAGKSRKKQTVCFAGKSPEPAVGDENDMSAARHGHENEEASSAAVSPHGEKMEEGDAVEENEAGEPGASDDWEEGSDNGSDDARSEESESEEQRRERLQKFIPPTYRRPLTVNDVCFCINTKCKKRFHILIVRSYAALLIHIFR